MRAGIRAGDFGGNRKADMEIEVLEKISQSREKANGFTTALKCCIACPSIPQIRGFIYVREHRSAQPRERDYGIESTPTSSAGTKRTGWKVRSG